MKRLFLLAFLAVVAVGFVNPVQAGFLEDVKNHKFCEEICRRDKDGRYVHPEPWVSRYCIICKNISDHFYVAASAATWGAGAYKDTQQILLREYGDLGLLTYFPGEGIKEFVGWVQIMNPSMNIYFTDNPADSTIDLWVGPLDWNAINIVMQSEYGITVEPENPPGYKATCWCGPGLPEPESWGTGRHLANPDYWCVGGFAMPVQGGKKWVAFATHKPGSPGVWSWGSTAARVLLAAMGMPGLWEFSQGGFPVVFGGEAWHMTTAVPTIGALSVLGPIGCTVGDDECLRDKAAPAYLEWYSNDANWAPFRVRLNPAGGWDMPGLLDMVVGVVDTKSPMSKPGEGIHYYHIKAGLRPETTPVTDPSSEEYSYGLDPNVNPYWWRTYRMGFLDVPMPFLEVKEIPKPELTVSVMTTNHVAIGMDDDMGSRVDIYGVRLRLDGLGDNVWDIQDHSACYAGHISPGHDIVCPYEWWHEENIQFHFEYDPTIDPGALLPSHWGE